MDANSNWSMTHIRLPRLWDGVEVDINDLVQVLGDNLGDFLELVEVIGLVLFIYKLVDSNGCQITHRNLMITNRNRGLYV